MASSIIRMMFQVRMSGSVNLALDSKWDLNTEKLRELFLSREKPEEIAAAIGQHGGLNGIAQFDRRKIFLIPLESSTLIFRMELLNLILPKEKLSINSFFEKDLPWQLWKQSN